MGWVGVVWVRAWGKCFVQQPIKTDFPYGLLSHQCTTIIVPLLASQGRMGAELSINNSTMIALRAHTIYIGLKSS
jgi:hypothetical protein